MNYKLILAYDGTRYRGFQKNRDGPTVESIVESTLTKILNHPVRLQAASRTDRGVHAHGQVINFFSDKDFDIQNSLNRLLPPDICVKSLEKMPDSFHPTVDAKKKTYFYQVFNAPVLLPHKRHIFWHYYYPLDLRKMRTAAKQFIGKKDFAAFTTLRTHDTIREIYSLDIQQENEDFFFTIVGNRFLYKMVRNIIGTLVYIGSNRLDINQLPTIFEKKLRKNAGVTAPARGLFLKTVHYT